MYKVSHKQIGLVEIWNTMEEVELFIKVSVMTNNRLRITPKRDSRKNYIIEEL